MAEGNQSVPAAGASGPTPSMFCNGRNYLEIVSARFACVFINRHGNLLSGVAGKQCWGEQLDERLI